MRLLAIMAVMLLASCGPRVDLSPCPGWEGKTPETMQDFALAASAEKYGRLCANSKLEVAAGLTRLRIGVR